jgi:hypothetical protein
MALESIVSPKSLKTTFLASIDRPRPLFFFYDEPADELMILLIPPDRETIVHYLDDHVGLLFDANNNEVVGLQIDGFNSSFTPKYVSLQKIWRLSDCKEIERANIGELSIAVQERQLKIALEVIKVSKPLLGKQAVELKRALEYA